MAIAHAPARDSFGRDAQLRAPLAPLTRRVAPVLAPVTLVGLAALGAAAVTLVETAPSLAELGGIALLVVGATLAEAFPVPIELEGLAAGGVSLAAVFIVGAAIIYGWAAAVVVAFVALAVIQLAHRRPWDRLLYNAAVYTLSGVAAGAAARRFTPRRTSAGSSSPSSSARPRSTARTSS